MFTNDTFVANHSITDNGSSTFVVSNDGVVPTEEINQDLIVEAHQTKQQLTYYKPIRISVVWEKTIKCKFVLVSLRLGDVIDFITRMTGIKKLIVKMTNGNCGCEQRRKNFNKWFAIPILKIWFDNFDADDKFKLQQKQKKNERKIATVNNSYYESVRKHITQQYIAKDNSDKSYFIADWPTTKERPQSGGCGCNKQFKKTVTTL